MSLLLSLYFWAILAGLAAAPVLAVLGSQLATRDRSMQTLCVGQGAMFGVLLGMGTLHYLEDWAWFSLGPLSVAVLMSALTFLITDRIASRRVASKGTVFIFVFAFLMAVSHLLAAILPGLETHMSQVYFGDLATLTETDSKIMLGGALVCGLLLLVDLRSLSNQSFEWAVFGRPLSPSARGQEWVFKALTLMVLSLGIQFVGFLFTIAVLFLPTAMLGFMKHQGLRLHYVACAVLATVGTGGGFLLSLHFSRLPTVPSIVGILFLGGLAVLGIDRTVYELSAWLRKSKFGVGGPVPQEG